MFPCLLDTIISAQYRRLFLVCLYYMEDIRSRLSAPQLKRKELKLKRRRCFNINLMYQVSISLQIPCSLFPHFDSICECESSSSAGRGGSELRRLILDVRDKEENVMSSHLHITMKLCESLHRKRSFLKGVAQNSCYCEIRKVFLHFCFDFCKLFQIKVLEGVRDVLERDWKLLSELLECFLIDWHCKF